MEKNKKQNSKEEKKTFAFILFTKMNEEKKMLSLLVGMSVASLSLQDFLFSFHIFPVFQFFFTLLAILWFFCSSIFVHLVETSAE